MKISDQKYTYEVVQKISKYGKYIFKSNLVFFFKLSNLQYAFLLSTVPLKIIKSDYLWFRRNLTFYFENL